MPLRLVSTIVNRDSFGKKLGKWADKIKNWKPFWMKVFYPRYVELVQQNFETEGELVGGWPGLNPKYASWKARHFPGTKILERTRRLRSSLAHGAVGSDTVLQARPLEFRFGTRVPWAKWVRLQGREFLPPIIKKDWEPLVREHFRNRLRDDNEE